MNRIRQLFLYTVLATFAAPLVAAERLHVIEHPAAEITIHLGAKGDSPGDLLTFSNPVFDSANQTQIGTDQGFCVRVIAGKSWQCTWTLILRDGALTVEGPYYDSGISSLAIVGGTGKYSGAKGEMVLNKRAGKPETFDFIYDLL